MSKPLNIILSVTTVTFAALYFSAGDQQQLPTVELKSNVESSELKKENTILKQELSKVQKELEMLKSMPERVVKVADTKKVQNSDNTPKVEVSEGVDSFRNMMNDPKIQAMMKKRRDDMVMERYGKILDRLDLSEEDKAKLMTLIGDKHMNRMQVFMRMRAAETDEEKENIKAMQEEMGINNENQIADLLGTKYDTFKNYEEMRNEYRMLESINKDQTLTQDQTDSLASAMKDVSDSFEFSSAKIQEDPRAYRELNDEEKAQYKLELEERDAQVLDEVASTLNDDQLEQFKKEQKRNRDRLTSSRGGSPFGRGRGGRR